MEALKCRRLKFGLRAPETATANPKAFRRHGQPSGLMAAERGQEIRRRGAKYL
jgi:hypothetical protein